MVAHQDRLRDGFREANEKLQHAIERPTELVKEYPVSSMMLMFGIGLGVGVVLSQTVCSSLMEMMEHEPTMTEKLRRQVYDAVSSVVPPSMLKQIQSYTS